MEYEMEVWRNRTLCSVLEEARMCCTTANYSYLPGLLEEIQHLGNRMESAIEYKNDAEKYRNKAKAALSELKDLQDEINKLKKKEGIV